ncbi:BRCT domain-containing protein At4g02110 [Rosa rugosa]|uniref:BRCT domain-containing protein At4g02110 n=1 Tax=Rosa rugosa TaxID=74645 RepID=UPI002B40CABB|nr:BRCT domain-containing protein At4g02110 [Rosa rugosa]
MMDSRAPPPKTFLGVRFVLLGFDPMNERQVRSKLLDCGGSDVGLYSPNCTHLIVDRITYDHPVCVAARNDGKTVVTALWVHHSFDVGMPLDAAAIIYRPLKHLNGIPGAKNLLMCLTGYHGQDRDDIMTMVGLMGAQFSKPLVASKVTHLICYKFEGDKYKLAKQLPQIKIVNHRWLEDCLRDWVLLQEDKYNQSGYELEIMEAEARDSEDEAEDTFIKQSVGRSMNKSCHNIQAGSPVPFRIPKSEGEVPMVPQNSVEKSISRNEDEFDQASIFFDVHVSKVPSPQDACKFKDATLGEHNDVHHTTPDSKKKDDMASTFGSAERSPPHSDRKLSYSRQSPWKSTLPLYLGDKSSYGSRSSKAPIRKLSVNDDFASSSFKAEENEKIDSNCVEALLKGNHVHNEKESTGILPQKRTVDHSYASPKLQKTSYDARSSFVRSPSCDTSPKEIPASLIDRSYKTTSHCINRNDEKSLDKTMTCLNAAETSGAVVSPTKSSTLTKKSLTCDVPSSTTLISEIGQDGNVNKRTPLSTFQRLRKSPLSSKPGIGELVMEESTTTVSETLEPQNQQQDVQGSSPRNEPSVINNSNDLANLDLHKGGTDDSTKSDRKKMLSKKTLGSRPKLTSANHKFSVYLDEDASLNVATVDTNAANQEKPPTALKPDLLSPDVSVKALKMAEVKDVTTSGNVSESKIDSLDDETEAPAEEDQHELESILEAKTTEKSEGVQHISNYSNPRVHGDAMASGENMQENEPAETVSVLVESTSKGVGDKGKNSGRKRPLGKTKLKTVPAITDKMNSRKGVSEDLLNHSDPCAHGDAMASMGNMQENEQGESISVLVESTSKGVGVIVKKNSGKKGPLGKTKLKTVPAVTDKMNSEKGVSEDVLNHSEPCVHGDSMASVEKIKGNEQGESVSMLVESTSKGDGAKGKKNNGKKRPLGRTKLKTSPAATETENTEETEMEEEGLACPVGKSKCCSEPKSKPEDSSELKENRPIACGDQNISKAKEQAEKSHVKCYFTPMEINQKLAKISRNSSIQEVKASDRVKTQPEWFILSGHQFERKEFQQIIKRLKGRCCRDSHNWSYQATHFIIPEPIRRIEKFFAAAASGRWILKSDYLAASNQAGKFVAEEPYEWYKSGLSEDGTINLEAPRKWRLLRERTGHGAFHGMRIIIYGDCIAPRLDTLKRVVKAGDGTILATCPPYTRFLNSGVDFAIVSPGMPRVDMWVQEFLKHEIPCVVADYLVEYVCKPGYPLERHVLYNTHAWAEKSFGRLQNKAEEVLVVVEEEEENHTYTPMDDSGNSDIPCVGCGSCDRGEVMLICGNESGSVGCGIGTHIDCCSPPLEDVPEGDWFCPKCSSQSKNASNPSKKRKKGKSK